jgi:hypothetical protein
VTLDVDSALRSKMNCRQCQSGSWRWLQAIKLAMEAADNADAATTLFCDDSLRNIAGGKAVGLHTVLVRTWGFEPILQPCCEGLSVWADFATHAATPPLLLLLVLLMLPWKSSHQGCLSRPQRAFGPLGGQGQGHRRRRLQGGLAARAAGGGAVAVRGAALGVNCERRGGGERRVGGGCGRGPTERSPPPGDRRQPG